MKKSIIAVFLLVFLFSLTSCKEGTDEPMSENNNIQEEQITYQIISQREAKDIIDSDTDYIILDVRTQDEYEAGHIPDAICIDHSEISVKAEKILPEKDKLILVYCRSGRRSKIAAQSLVDLGYTNVKEFGGIIDWKYETVTEKTTV